jgi:hypothetical protein
VQTRGESFRGIDEVDGERGLEIRATLWPHTCASPPTTTEHLAQEITEPTSTSHVAHVEAE